MDRTILHFDLDAFYASVEQLDHPELRDSPVIVGGHGLRGVVSAASYEARAFGVHSAMPMARATQLCPAATVLRVRMQRYRELAHQVFAVYHDYTDLIEPLSIDEAFLDVTASRRLFGTGLQMARMIRRRVLERTGLTVSAGISVNKFLAKVASARAKPDGILEVQRDRIGDFLYPLPVGELWGVGKVAAAKLEQHGIRRVRDIAGIEKERLKKLLGDKLGEQICCLAQGIDEREVEPDHGEKSIGAEKTYARDLQTIPGIEKALLRLAEEVGRRVRAGRFRGRCLTLKVRHDDFTTVSRSQTQTPGLHTTQGVYQAARELLRKTEAGHRPVRLLGISLSQLESEQSGQVELFVDRSERRQEVLDGAVDELRRRFGPGGVVRGTLLDEHSKK